VDGKREILQRGNDTTRGFEALGQAFYFERNRALDEPGDLDEERRA